MGRAEQITRSLKNYDSKLYCASSKEGKLCVYRNSTRYDYYDLGDGNVLGFARPAPHFIFALTEDWTTNTNSREWGVLPILDRLRASDLQQRDIVSDLEKHYEEKERSTERDLRNNNEAFLYDFRDRFKETFKDINTSSMDKSKDLRKKNEKRIKGA